jgi:nitrate/nitrite transporter NarK
MYAPYGPFFAIVPERIPRNVTAQVFTLINSVGALGGFCGAYFVGALQTGPGDTRASFLLMSFSLLCAAGLMFLLPDAPRVEQQ